MKSLGWACIGVVLGVAFVLIAGILGIQIVGQRAGALFSLDGSVVGVVSPRTPWLPMLATAALGVLVMFFLTVGANSLSRGSRRALISGFALATMALVAWSLVLGPGILDEEIPLGVREGVLGWVSKGGDNPAVHVVALLSIGSLWLRRTPEQSAARAAPEEASIDQP